MFSKNYMSVISDRVVSGETLNQIVEEYAHKIDRCIQGYLTNPQLDDGKYTIPAVMSNHISFKLNESSNQATGIASMNLIIEADNHVGNPKVAIAIYGLDGNNVITLAFFLKEDYEYKSLRALMENAIVCWFYRCDENSKKEWNSPEEFWDNLEDSCDVPTKVEKNA